MRSIVLCVLAFALLGCHQFEPFIDARHEAGQVQTVGQSSADAPAVCYNPLWSDENRVNALAESECQKQKKHAVLVEKDYFSCCLLFPATAFYECEESV